MIPPTGGYLLYLRQGTNNAVIGWRELNADDRNVWVRSAATTIALIGGTRFRGANLTETNLTQAQIEQIALTGAILTETHKDG
ncbi:MAG: pentapeptide repeat-containing protein [Leptolyngbyaceae cyanobacterium MO_188.B28]|nr:pentapeptide repeat-containing protein [Leptolyngbyaceae cyanobacterium MO_188.B28]